MNTVDKAADATVEAVRSFIYFSTPKLSKTSTIIRWNSWLVCFDRDISAYLKIIVQDKAVYEGFKGAFERAGEAVSSAVSLCEYSLHFLSGSESNTIILEK